MRKLHLYEYIYREQRIFLAEKRGQVKAYLRSQGISGYKAEQFLFFRGRVRPEEYPQAMNLVQNKDKE